ncbi:type IV pilus assembly PilZ [Thermocrinis albus DSM 14484]|uniref:Type IV pilus assembly PilZ n=1 Tax=Thermocrinis albus (strain DSM 14484 / JCM 11386 / HI 11/12) TaxID=638303 RepID=D3SMK6_THEAH|nr:PilZ domain-containing protein [Thermocrinis albus]ADC89986.1 type IV pilus assembly PilZ [Thermocrinis albus DSM 14484]
MEYQGGFETFREATRYMFQKPTLTDVLGVILILLLSVLLLLLIPYLYSRYVLGRRRREEFLLYARQMGLEDKEAYILYSCAKRLKEPLKVLNSKVVFERCVSHLVREKPDSVEFIPVIRRKLRFDYLPWFIPLTTSREIDLYQTGFVSCEGGMYGAAVWEKTEEEIHIALLEEGCRGVGVGDTVKFIFTREDDGRYHMTAPVLRSYRDRNRLVLVLPHVDKLGKIQLRETVRWKVRIPALLWVAGLPRSVEVIVEDISPGGLRACKESFLDLTEGQEVSVTFEWKGYSFRDVRGIVKHVRGSADRTCVGIQWVNVNTELQDLIRKLIIEEQREVLRLYKLGELKEGSAS